MVTNEGILSIQYSLFPVDIYHRQTDTRRVVSKRYTFIRTRKRPSNSNTYTNTPKRTRYISVYKHTYMPTGRLVRFVTSLESTEGAAVYDGDVGLYDGDVGL